MSETGPVGPFDVLRRQSADYAVPSPRIARCRARARAEPAGRRVENSAVSLTTYGGASPSLDARFAALRQAHRDDLRRPRPRPRSGSGEAHAAHIDLVQTASTSAARRPRRRSLLAAARHWGVPLPACRADGDRSSPLHLRGLEARFGWSSASAAAGAGGRLQALQRTLTATGAESLFASTDIQEAACHRPAGDLPPGLEGALRLDRRSLRQRVGARAFTTSRPSPVRTPGRGASWA